MENDKGKYKHLDLSDRIVIESSLESGLTLKKMAEKLCKDPTTISKELRRHRIKKKPRTLGDYARCRHKSSCKKKNICGGTYQDTLKSARTGIDMTEEELVRLDQLVTPLILRGQSLAHIYATHRS